MSVFLDQYSYLHFSTGVVAYFWGIDFYIWIIIHILYELFENLYASIHIINRYITYWPGGKSCPDPIINRVGDVVSGALGWLSAYYLDNLGGYYRWYQPHILANE
jgi:hypothetical protein|uniref:Uncharacterized protein n=1 Tax=viral metagenome TaxID=1070528 RepID=A0A6C0IUX0_9ZZZZ